MLQLKLGRPARNYDVLAQYPPRYSELPELQNYRAIEAGRSTAVFGGRIDECCYSTGSFRAEVFEREFRLEIADMYEISASLIQKGQARWQKSLNY